MFERKLESAAVAHMPKNPLLRVLNLENPNPPKKSLPRNILNSIYDTLKASLSDFKSDNANIKKSPSGKMLNFGSTISNAYTIETVLSEKFAKAHTGGDIHIHDLDYYNFTVNCLQVPLNKLLKGGFNTGNGYIRPPKRIASATSLVAIILQSEQNDQFGGVGIANFDFDMADFVVLERKNIAKNLSADLSKFNANYSEEDFNRLVEEKLDNAIFQAMEGLIHNLNTMHSRAGAQVPFTSINLGCDTTVEGRLITKNFLLAYKAGLGNGEIPIFPQVIFKIKEGINFEPAAPNYDLLQLAIEIAATRLNPTFLFCDSSFNKKFSHKQLGTMGCRTRVVENVNGVEGTEGRGNLSFTSMNLPRLALLAQSEGGSASEIFESFLEKVVNGANLVIEQLLERYAIQKNLKVEDIPFMLGQKLYVDSENLSPKDYAEAAFKNGTMAIGFIGIAEVLKIIFGQHHGENEELIAKVEEILATLKAQTDKATKEHGMNFSIIATPAEGLSHKFTGIDEKKFGNVDWVISKGFYTNGFHIPVDYAINAYKKLEIEAKFHKYCLGGHISYTEFESSPEHNLVVLNEAIKRAKSADSGYIGFNFPYDQCNGCHEHGVFEDTCPHCGSENIMRVRRVTGYLGYLNNFTKGKTKEEKLRKSHY
ncbi:MAG: anaerobic ribonucleoside-triphosphate reductase [Alphaproteobacteria bacterium]|jgi:ribonucleoside-triphosphate reductase|nr:anaerobic ribonucleoside-triphosphate reductase [Alphaproteobacteria bacterium]